jgi:hypothetical protein
VQVPGFDAGAEFSYYHTLERQARCEAVDGCEGDEA